MQTGMCASGFVCCWPHWKFYDYIYICMRRDIIMCGIVCCMAGMLLTACDMFEYHPYSIDINGRTNIHAENVERIEQLCKGRDVVRFAFVTDTQGCVDELEDAVADIRRRDDIDFIIHGGDQTDFGLPKEFVWCRDMLDKSGLPYVAVIGNHDCVGNGEHTFEYMYGKPNFSFNAGFVHFLCLNTVALEYDYSKPVPDLNFIESDRDNVMALNEERDSIVHTIVVMHSRPGDEQFNNNLFKVFNYYLEQFPGADGNAEIYDTGVGEAGAKKHAFCVNGHNHCDDVRDIYDNGMIYYGCTDMSKRVYYVFTITKEGYDYERVAY